MIYKRVIVVGLTFLSAIPLFVIAIVTNKISNALGLVFMLPILWYWINAYMNEALKDPQFKQSLQRKK